MDKSRIHIEGVKMSLEEGIEHLRKFVVRKGFEGSFNYALIMEEDDGTHTVVERIGMPCWGALREYEKGTRPDDDWPTDLREPKHLFPATGKPVRVAACFNRSVTPKGVKQPVSWLRQYEEKADAWNSFLEFVFDKNISPWRKACNDVELVKNADGIYWGCIFHDTKIDPNAMIALLRTNVSSATHAVNWDTFMKAHPGVDPRVAYIKAGNISDYWMAGRIIPEAFFGGQMVDISAGGTFYERESYNRPDISYVFGGKGNVGQIISKHDVAYWQGVAQQFA